MSFSALTENAELKGRQASLGPTPGSGRAFLENMAAVADNVWKNNTVAGEIQYRGGAFRKRNDLLKERFGKDQFEISKAWEKYPSRDPSAFGARMEFHQNEIDSFIEKGRKDNPAQFDGIKTSREIQDEMKALTGASDMQMAEVKYRNRDAWLASGVGGFVGGAAATMADPVNAITLPLGAGAAPVGAKGFAYMRGLLKASAIEGALNAGVEAAQQPAIAAWQKYTGHRYGVGDAVANVAFAFGGGAAFRGMIEGALPAFRKGAQVVGSASQHVFEKIAFSRYMPESMKQAAAARGIAREMDQVTAAAAQYMARQAHIDETHPPGSVKTEKDLDAHRAQAEAVARDFEEFKDGNIPPERLDTEGEGGVAFTRDAAALARYDEMLQQARGKAALPPEAARAPMAQYLRDLGGVKVGSALDADLRSMGITPKTAPGLFRKKGGRGEADNIPASEFRDATGIEPQVKDDGYVDPAWLREQLRGETFARPKTAAASPAAALDDFIRTVEERGLDVKTAKAEDVYDVLDEETYQSTQIRQQADAMGENLSVADVQAIKAVMRENPDLTAEESIADHAERLALVEYYSPPLSPERVQALPTLPEAVPEMDRFTRARAEFDAMLKETPDMPVFLEDGRVVTMQALSDMVDEDMAIAEAIVSCRLA